MPINPNKIDYSKGFPESISSFEVIEDPRVTGNTRHHFGEILFISVTALICGMNGFSEIVDFAKLQKSWFKKWISLPHGIPCKQTFSNIFQAIDPEKFQQCIIDHIQGLNPDIKAQIIAIDGKSLRGSHELGKGAIHAVSAWAADSGITLAQSFVEDKSNEITAIPKLLEMLDLKGSIITMDAMGTQTDIAKKIVDQGGDYLLALKGNQKSTYHEVIDHLDYGLKQLDLKTAKGWDHHHCAAEKGHGRVTTRTVLSTSNLDTFDAEIKSKWAGLKSIIVVETETVISATNKTRKRDRRYYLSSLDVSAEEFQHIARRHWSIENQCHWVLDVVFKEDANRIRKGNAAKNYASLLRIALNILKSDTSLKATLPKKRRHAAFDLDYREALLISRAG